jgi:hypothetical protein
LKNKKLVNIVFEYNGTSYKAKAYEFASTVILLPDHTALRTIGIVQTTGPRRSNDKKHVRRFIDKNGRPYLLKVTHHPSIAFAEKQ